MRIELWPVKGGVGTSTIAATLAANLIKDGQTSNIICTNAAELVDQCAIFATPNIALDAMAKSERPIEIRELNDGSIVKLMYTDYATVREEATEHADVTIVVRSKDRLATAMFKDSAYNILITERTYLGANQANKLDKVKFDMAITYSMPECVLTMQDMAAVLNLKHVFDWPYDRAVLRSIDAGLYANRGARINYQAHHEILNHIKGKKAHASNS